MSASEIVKYNGTSADKLGALARSVTSSGRVDRLIYALCWTERILRHLATHHVFQEVSPGVFAHNMLSSLLDTGKDFEAILKEYVISVLKSLGNLCNRNYIVQTRSSITPMVSRHMYPVCTSIQIRLPSKHALIIFFTFQNGRTAKDIRITRRPHDRPSPCRLPRTNRIKRAASVSIRPKFDFLGLPRAT